MPRARSLKEAFAYFGAVKTNPVWGWAARSPDGATVAITMWEDQMEEVDGRIIYDVTHRGDLEVWRNRDGNKDRIRQLQWAIEHCHGLVRSVIVRAEDPKAVPRKVVSSEAHPTLIMRISRLDEETGEFYAESIT